jgi:glycosyltransferase involved in cell wall biosynthesis
MMPFAEAPVAERAGLERPGESPGVDAVYFLMFEGWPAELPANRWHFARRWARHKPVVLIQPTLRRAKTRARPVPEPRIDNCEILTLRAFDVDDVAGTAVVQVAQTLDHMATRRHRRPLLWCYNPNLVGLYAGLPAASRIFHATENYFHFPHLDEAFYVRVRASWAISDAVIAVSSGIRDTVAHETGVAAHVITNGCDFGFYADAPPDADLQAGRSAFDRIAVYAGNVNSRLDFELLADAAASYPSTLFALYGPVAGLREDETARWQGLLRQPNVHHFGAVPVDRLPGLYAAADVGLIPYRREQLIVENGFPLKTLEMAATGLPVVSSLMRPIVGLAEAIHIAATADEFVAAVGQLSRSSLTDGQRRELIEVSRRNDYDVKFQAVRALVAQDLQRPQPVETRLDDVIRLIGVDVWRAVCDARHRREVESQLLLLRLYRSLAGLVPERLRGGVPPQLRSWIRTRLGERRTSANGRTHDAAG